MTALALPPDVDEQALRDDGLVAADRLTGGQLRAFLRHQSFWLCGLLGLLTLLWGLPDDTGAWLVLKIACGLLVAALAYVKLLFMNSANHEIARRAEISRAGSAGVVAPRGDDERPGATTNADDGVPGDDRPPLRLLE